MPICISGNCGICEQLLFVNNEVAGKTMKEIRLPIDEKRIRALRAGDAVSISGMVHTGRDRFHKHFADGGKVPVDFRDGAL